MSFFSLAWEAQLISYKEPSIRREWWDCRLLMGSRDGLATRNGLEPGQVAQFVRTMVGKLISHRAANRGLPTTGLERCPHTAKLGVWSLVRAPIRSIQWMHKKVEKQIPTPLLSQINKKKERNGLDYKWRAPVGREENRWKDFWSVRPRNLGDRLSAWRKLWQDEEKLFKMVCYVLRVCIFFFFLFSFFSLALKAFNSLNSPGEVGKERR